MGENVPITNETPLLGLLTSDKIKTLTAAVGASTHGESFIVDPSRNSSGWRRCSVF
jgi:hypothetical protein